MYTRQEVWQETNIYTTNNSGWINEFSLQYSSVDIRFTLKGYGWKPNSGDVNLDVLYEGSYDCYYREVGSLDWLYFATVISERATYDDNFVYKDISVALGRVEKKIYEVKVEAVDAERYTSWGGTLEGITSGGQFWIDLQIRTDRPLQIDLYETLWISEFTQNLDAQYINLSIYESITLTEYINVKYSFSLFILDNAIISEFANVEYAPHQVNVFDIIGIIVEDLELFEFTVFLDAVFITEYVDIYYPVLGVYGYDEIYPREDIEIFKQITNLVINENIVIVEYASVRVTPLYASVSDNILAGNWSIKDSVVAQWKMNNAMTGPGVWYKIPDSIGVAGLGTHPANIDSAIAGSATAMFCLNTYDGIPTYGIDFQAPGWFDGAGMPRVSPTLNHFGIITGSSLQFSSGSADSPFTMFAFVKVEATDSGTKTIISRWDNSDATKREYIFAIVDKKVYLRMDDTSVTSYPDVYCSITSATVLSVGWHFVAISYSASNKATGMEIYIDGVKESAPSRISGNYYTCMQLTSAGQYLARANNAIYYGRQMTNIVLMNRVISQREITAVWNNGNGTNDLGTTSSEVTMVKI